MVGGGRQFYYNCEGPNTFHLHCRWLGIVVFSDDDESQALRMIIPVSLQTYRLPVGYWRCTLCVLFVKLPIGTPFSIKYFTENLTDLRRKIFSASDVLRL